MPSLVFFRSFALLLACCASPTIGQIFPLFENDWNDPTFVATFRGSFGVNSAIEPQITTEESQLFEELTPLLQQNQSRQAIARLQTVITPESSAALDFTLASLFLQRGDFASAERDFREALRKFPSFMRAYRNLGLAQVQQGRYDEGRQSLTAAIELGDKQGDTFGLIAYCYLNSGQLEAALNAYRLASVLSPDNTDWQLGKATALQQTDQHPEAIAAFRSLLEENPDRAQYFLVIANSYLVMGEDDSAAEFLEILRRMGQADATVLMLLGDIYVNQNLPAIATNTYLEVVEDVSLANLSRILRFSGALVQRGEYAFAQRVLDELDSHLGADLPTGDRDNMLNLQSQIALAQGDDVRAVAVLQEIIGRDPTNGRSLLLLAQFYERSGDLEEAAYYFDRAAQIDAVQLEALIQRARLAVSQSDYEAAIPLLERAQGIDRQENVQRFLEAVRRIARNF